MSRLVVLVEERSIQDFLDVLVPRLFPNLPFLCVPHEGKRDLEASLPRKLRGWTEPGARFLVVRDNDQGDCQAIKARPQEICDQAGRPDVTIRIACQELEAWYLGEPDGLAAAFGQADLRTIRRKARFRNPDAVVNPARELQNLVPEFQKISGARRMARELDADRNASRSFQVLIESIRRYHDASRRRQVGDGGARLGPWIGCD